MGWEVITNNLTGGDTLEDLPEGYRVDKDFINAFFESFRERVDLLIPKVTIDLYYDNLILDPDASYAIGHQELNRRFKSFNDLVILTITTFLIRLYKQESWDQLEALTDSELYTGSSSTLGLGLVDIERWSNLDVINLLTQEIYDKILDTSNYRKFKEASYWSAIYKIEKYILINIEPSTTNAVFDENSDITKSPSLYLNDQVLYSDFWGATRESWDPSIPVTDTTLPTTKINEFISNSSTMSTPSASEDIIYTCSLEYSDELSQGSNSLGSIQSSASMFFRDTPTDPYMYVTTPVDINILFNREDSFYLRDEESGPPTTTDVYFEKTTSGALFTNINGVQTYTPSQEVFDSKQASRFSVMTSYDSNTKIMTVPLSSFYDDLRSVNDLQFITVSRGTEVGLWNDDASEDQRNTIQVNLILIRVRQSELAYPIS